jgi:uracil-DNA glycosylase
MLPIRAAASRRSAAQAAGGSLSKAACPPPRNTRSAAVRLSRALNPVSRGSGRRAERLGRKYRDDADGYARKVSVTFTSEDPLPGRRTLRAKVVFTGRVPGRALQRTGLAFDRRQSACRIIYEVEESGLERTQKRASGSPQHHCPGGASRRPAQPPG